MLIHQVLSVEKKPRDHWGRSLAVVRGMVRRSRSKNTEEIKPIGPHPITPATKIAAKRAGIQLVREESVLRVWENENPQKRKPSRTSHVLALLACRNRGTWPEFMFPTFINYLQSVKRWQQFLPLHPLSNEGWRTKRLGGRIAKNLEVFPMDDRIIHGMIIVLARFCPMMALSLHACWTKSPTHLPQGCTHYKIQFDLAVMLF